MRPQYSELNFTKVRESSNLYCGENWWMWTGGGEISMFCVDHDDFLSNNVNLIFLSVSIIRVSLMEKQ